MTGLDISFVSDNMGGGVQNNKLHGREMKPQLTNINKAVFGQNREVEDQSWVSAKEDAQYLSNTDIEATAPNENVDSFVKTTPLSSMQPFQRPPNNHCSYQALQHELSSLSKGTTTSIIDGSSLSTLNEVSELSLSKDPEWSNIPYELELGTSNNANRKLVEMSSLPSTLTSSQFEMKTKSPKDLKLNDVLTSTEKQSPPRPHKQRKGNTPKARFSRGDTPSPKKNSSTSILSGDIYGKPLPATPSVLQRSSVVYRWTVDASTRRLALECIDQITLSRVARQASIDRIRESRVHIVDSSAPPIYASEPTSRPFLLWHRQPTIQPSDITLGIEYWLVDLIEVCINFNATQNLLRTGQVQAAIKWVYRDLSPLRQLLLLILIRLAASVDGYGSYMMPCADATYEFVVRMMESQDIPRTIIESRSASDSRIYSMVEAIAFAAHTRPNWGLGNYRDNSTSRQHRDMARRLWYEAHVELVVQAYGGPDFGPNVLPEFLKKFYTTFTVGDLAAGAFIDLASLGCPEMGLAAWSPVVLSRPGVFTKFLSSRPLNTRTIGLRCLIHIVPDVAVRMLPRPFSVGPACWKLVEGFLDGGSTQVPVEITISALNLLLLLLEWPDKDDDQYTAFLTGLLTPRKGQKLAAYALSGNESETTVFELVWALLHAMTYVFPGSYHSMLEMVVAYEEQAGGFRRGSELLTDEESLFDTDECSDEGSEVSESQLGLGSPSAENGQVPSNRDHGRIHHDIDVDLASNAQRSVVASIPANGLSGSNDYGEWPSKAAQRLIPYMSPLLVGHIAMFVGASMLHLGLQARRWDVELVGRGILAFSRSQLAPAIESQRRMLGYRLHMAAHPEKFMSSEELTTFEKNYYRVHHERRLLRFRLMRSVHANNVDVNMSGWGSGTRSEIANNVSSHDGKNETIWQILNPTSTATMTNHQAAVREALGEGEASGIDPLLFASDVDDDEFLDDVARATGRVIKTKARPARPLPLFVPPLHRAHTESARKRQCLILSGSKTDYEKVQVYMGLPWSTKPVITLSSSDGIFGKKRPISELDGYQPLGLDSAMLSTPSTAVIREWAFKELFLG